MNGYKSSCLTVDGDETGNEDEDYPTLEEEEQMMNANVATAQPSSAGSANSDHQLPSGFEKLLHQNYPIICQIYIDPVTENQKVLAVVSLPGGAQNVKIDLATDGLSATVKYSWAKSMYDVEDLFKTQLDAREFGAYHPMLLCMKQGLALARKKMDVAPAASIKVELPIKCQTSTNSWKKWGVVRDDGAQVLIADFNGLVNEYVVKTANENYVFQR